MSLHTMSFSFNSANLSPWKCTIGSLRNFFTLGGNSTLPLPNRPELLDKWLKKSRGAPKNNYLPLIESYWASLSYCSGYAMSLKSGKIEANSSKLFSMSSRPRCLLFYCFFLVAVRLGYFFEVAFLFCYDVNFRAAYKSSSMSGISLSSSATGEGPRAFFLLLGALGFVYLCCLGPFLPLLGFGTMGIKL